MAAQEPAYEVIASDGAIEIRRYPAYAVAETRIDGSRAAGAAGNEGFSRLVRYISGNNRSRSDIAMTAPVAQSRGGEKIAMTAPVGQTADAYGDWLVSFVMPASYGLDDLPEPADDRIRLRLVKSRLVAVVRYSGSWKESRYRKHEHKLLTRISELNGKVTGTPEFARYNAPFVPGFFRRNEVMVEIAGVPAMLAEKSDSRMILASPN